MAKLFILTIFASLFLSCSQNIYQQKEEYIKFKNNGRHIYIKLKVNQYDAGNFYFDTASPWLVIDSTFYKSQEMSFNNYSEYENSGGAKNLPKIITIRDTINFSINKNTFYSRYNNMIYNLKNSLGKNIDGIVGFNKFGNTPFRVDYAAQKIILNPKINDSYQEVAIKFDGNYMYVPIKLMLSNGTTIMRDFVIDTGSYRTILTSESANNKDIKNLKKATYIDNGGIGGSDLGFSLFAPEVKIDRFKLVDREINVSKDSLGVLSNNKNYFGIIGNDILDDFDIIYYPTHNKIWIKPSKNFNKPSEDLYKSFILIETIDKDKGWIVGGIYEKGDAYQEGLRHKDEVVEINNKAVKKLNLLKWNSKLKPNQKIKLKVKRGNEFIEIATYLNIFLKKNE